MRKSDFMELPGFDCGKCGFESCKDLSDAVAKGKAVIGDCTVLNAGKTVILKVSGRDVPLKSFVQDFIKGTTLGMIKSLKEGEVKEGDIVEIKILVTLNDL
ncbi:MAG: (Fe-S)-binding protein [Candidatus Hydrothermarchaeaceae archaeon]